MPQLPPDSHCATASQLTLELALAGEAVPSSAAVPAAPAATTPSAMRACLRIFAMTRNLRAYEVSCRVRAEEPGRGRAASPRGALAAHRGTLGPPLHAWLTDSRRSTARLGVTD